MGAPPIAGGIPCGGPPIPGGPPMGGTLAVPPCVRIFIKSSIPAMFLISLVGIRFGIPVVLVYHLGRLSATGKYLGLHNLRFVAFPRLLLGF